SDDRKSSNRTDFEVEVSNGNGVHRMARRLGYFLKDKGFKVTRLTNAGHFNYPESIIFYNLGYKAEAKRLAKHLPGRQQLRMAGAFGRSSIKLKVLIGKDVIPFDRELKTSQSQTGLVTANALLK
ncbi:MAG: LytR C-terminal domain-containing protein, partial [Desulfobacterales bacterium]